MTRAVVDLVGVEKFDVDHFEGFFVILGTTTCGYALAAGRRSATEVSQEICAGDR